jgi:hypothetical protein
MGTGVSGEGNRGRSRASGLTYTMRAGLHCDTVLVKVKVKVNESRNRHGVAQGIPGGLGSQIS